MKVAIIYPDAFSIWIFHRHLLLALQAQGHEVFAISADDEYSSRLTSAGIAHIPVRMSRHLSVRDDLLLCLDLFRVFRRHRFDVVHTFTIKANTFGAIVARLAGVGRVICTAEGLGFVYGDRPGMKLRMMRPVASLLYRLGGAACTRFWFVNPDDLQLFASRGIVPRRKAFLTISAGVDCTEFRPVGSTTVAVQSLRQSLGLAPAARVIVMVVARAIWSKGIREFFDAAEVVRREQSEVEFLLIGPIERHSPDAVPESYLVERTAATGARWLGFRRDVKDLYALADVVVLPSYYREGVPNVLLEAMAMGKPVVTTDWVGCREVVADGHNGFLVPIRDSAALAAAIAKLASDDEMRRRFGAQSLLRVQCEFDKQMIVDRVVTELYSAAANAAPVSNETRQVPAR